MGKTVIIAEPGKQSIVITRVFDAPRELVYKTCMDPKFIPQWWGPKRFTTSVDRMDVKFGGVWRFVQRDANGNVFAFRGVYHVVTPPAQVVSTFEFEGMPGHVMLETVSYEEMEGKTKVTINTLYQSVEDRDGMRSSGHDGGVTESHERLQELLTAQMGVPTR